MYESWVEVQLTLWPILLGCPNILAARQVLLIAYGVVKVQALDLEVEWPDHLQHW